MPYSLLHARQAVEYISWDLVRNHYTTLPMLYDKFLDSDKVMVCYDITTCHKAHGRILKVSEFSYSVCTVVRMNLILRLIICKNFSF
jgi:hypothetical protein